MGTALVWHMVLSLTCLNVLGRLRLLEGLQERLRSGVWYIRISGLKNVTPSNYVVPPCAKALLLN